MAFFGRYIEVAPLSRLVWTNEEDEDGAVTTVTFEERDGKTLVVVERPPSLEEKRSTVAIASRCTGGWPEQFEQLDDVLTTLAASASSGVE